MGWPPSDFTVASWVGRVIVRMRRPPRSAAVWIGRLELLIAKKPPESSRPSTLRPVLADRSAANFWPNGLPRSITLCTTPMFGKAKGMSNTPTIL